MIRIVSLAIVVAMTIMAVSSHQRFASIEQQYQLATARIHELESVIARDQGSLAVTQQLAMANHQRIERNLDTIEEIKSLAPRRVVTVTAYTPRAEETDSSPFITASNRKVRPGIVAVSRDLFEDGWVFGKKVYIKDLGVFIIDDLMASSKSQQIDVFMFDHSQAITFGSQTREAFLLGA